MSDEQVLDGVAGGLGGAAEEVAQGLAEQAGAQSAGDGGSDDVFHGFGGHEIAEAQLVAADDFVNGAAHDFEAAGFAGEHQPGGEAGGAVFLEGVEQGLQAEEVGFGAGIWLADLRQDFIGEAGHHVFHQGGLQAVDTGEVVEHGGAGDVGGGGDIGEFEVLGAALGEDGFGGGQDVFT